MSERLVEIWNRRNRPLLSERGMRLLLRERGLTESQINSVLKEISFADILKKAGSAVKNTATGISATSGKVAGANLKLKANKWWKKYAAGAGINPDTPSAEDFLEWLEDTYQMPESIISRLNIGGKNIVDIVEKEPRNLTKDETEGLLAQIAREEFKYLQSGKRYGSRMKFNASDTDDEDVLKALKNTIISDTNFAKLQKQLEKNPEFLNQLLDRVLKNTTTETIVYTTHGK
jgi:hypothetical protein